MPSSTSPAGPIRSGPTPARVLPVLDVQDGRAVLAKGGERDHYRPVDSGLHAGSDPIGLARVFRDRLGLSEPYLADLDAIAGAPPARPLCEALVAEGLRPWVDAGLRDASGPAGWLLGPGAGPITVVAALETLRGPGALAEIVAAAGAGRVAFGLDLRDGRPLGAGPAAWGTSDPFELAALAVGLGCRRVLVLDLARVGAGGGPGTLPLLRRLSAAFPGVELAAGGGVSGPADLAELAAAGASAVLVGSALHDGRIGPGHLGR